MIVNGAHGTLFQLYGIHQIDHASVTADVRHNTAGADRDHQCTKFHFVQGFVDNPLLKYHLRVQPACALQGNLIRLHDKCSCHTAHAGEIAFFIAQQPCTALILQHAFRDQFYLIRLLPQIALSAKDGKHNALLHLRPPAQAAADYR